MSERTYLRDVQYCDDTNLNARVELHRRFSVNSGSFHRWVFDQLDVPGVRARLLEVGCGSRAPLGCKQGADASRLGSLSLQLLVGMITAARSRLGAGFRLEVADAEAMPISAPRFLPLHHQLRVLERRVGKPPHSLMTALTVERLPEGSRHSMCALYAHCVPESRGTT